MQLNLNAMFLGVLGQACLIAKQNIIYPQQGRIFINKNETNRYRVCVCVCVCVSLLVRACMSPRV